MQPVLRSRECIVYFKGDIQTVAVHPDLIRKGWKGGSLVQWVPSTEGDIRMVTGSQGRYGGLLVWGSDEVGDDFTAITRTQTVYRQATLFSGGSLISTSSYERHTWASRQGGNLVPLVYGPDQPLFISRQGLWTCEDEMTLVGDPKAPAPLAGFVSQLPKSLNSFFLGVQTSLG